jgi:alanine-glyoxylate transaminase/serine-glyoxylate transaminase/serine-pyruvate transaminase
MSLLPENDRILLGPGPSLTSPRVMRAMAAPTLSHLDPQMLALLDDVRARLTRTFRAADGSFAFAGPAPAPPAWKRRRTCPPGRVRSSW